MCQSFYTSTPTTNRKVESPNKSNTMSPLLKPKDPRVLTPHSPLMPAQKKNRNILNTVREKNLLNKLNKEEESVLVCQRSPARGRSNSPIVKQKESSLTYGSSFKFDLMSVCKEKVRKFKI